MATVVTKWAKLTYDPKPAQSKLPEAKPELTAAIEVDEQKARLYWVTGSNYDYLKQGDTVLVEWRDKWKLATQTPELLKTLENRRQSSAPPAPTDAPAAQRSNGDRGNDNDVIEMGNIAGKLQAMLPDWTEQAIASLACTVFISRK
jgi:hypothetical protein